MKHRARCRPCAIKLLALAPLFVASLAAAEPVPAPLTFERDIRPIFKAHCFQCHGEDKQIQGGLDLRLRRLAVTGGETGPALVPENRDESLLFIRIRDGEMPPGKKKLSAEEIAKIGQWIAAGAKTARAEPENADEAGFITEEDRSFWAFQPVRRPEIPQVEHGRKATTPSRVRTPIDAFLLAGLEAQQLSFAPDADKTTLIRRATIDLLGLPPTPDEVTAFLADEAPDAYERLLERLLASPHYGERWGRHWLDVAGYADSEGYTEDDPPRKHAWRYRDYVIRAFNADKPLDQFIVEQLAGDELVPYPYNNLLPEQVEMLAATGFLRMAPDGTASSGIDRNLASNQVVADTLKIVSSSLLGLTVACAQCHDHRYDPISQSDYYRLRAIFEPAFHWKAWRTPQARLISLYTEADRDRAKQIEAEAARLDTARSAKQQEFINQVFERELAKVPEELREPIREAWTTAANKRNADQNKLLKEHPSVNVSAGSLYLFDKKAADELKAMTDEAARLRATKPEEGFVHALTEVSGSLPATYLFARGDHEQPKQELPPAELAILTASPSTSPIPVDDPALPTSGRRLAYAKWLTSGQHPLTARVLVNRVWMHHFGRGIVGSPSDFGVLGERPTHPELLDWLADELVAGEWKLKRLHKLIMTSTAYRQSSRGSESQAAVDPDNRLLGHKSLQRLDAETLRDCLLATAGKLNRRMFGPPVPVMADEVGQFVVGIENLNAGRPQGVIPMNGEEFRRSAYIQARRSRPLSVMAAFDAPTMEPNCEARNASTVAPQSLMLLNNAFVIELSEAFARRVRHDAGDGIEAQAELAWKLAMGTAAEKATIDELATFLREQAKHFETTAAVQTKPAAKDVQPPDRQLLALANLCQALWSSNEFLYVE